MTTTAIDFKTTNASHLSPPAHDMMTQTLTTPKTAQNDVAALRAAWHTATQDRKMRVRDAAEFLGVSECELVATQVGAEATRLEGPWIDVLKRVGSLGRVMALTRNNAVVHERKGPYKDVSATGMMGLVLGEDIDLRLFLSHWTFGYAVVEQDGEYTKRSLQFFDAAGDAVHKIFLQPESSVDEFDLLVAQFTSDNQAPGEIVGTRAVPAAPAPDAEIDVASLRVGWANLKDTHEFFGLLKQHKVARTQAMRLADPAYVRRVDNTAARAMLEAAAQHKADIMCFVGNAGCIQIHTGPVANIKVMGPWLNVLDTDFNLHLREDMVHETWVVQKPTTEGMVTSLELFDRAGVQLVQFFGKRKPGIPERADWREILKALPSRANGVAA